MPILLKGDAEPRHLTGDERGRIAIRHLRAGTYRIAETEAPDGYLVDPETRSFTVDERGLAEGSRVLTVRVEDERTQIDISKLDIGGEREIAGARLAILDADGAVVASWVSDAVPHRIEGLAPGAYTLVEEMTPRAYDQAAEVPFTVEERGDIQRVAMRDAPIEITGDVDKRQEVFDPARRGPNGKGGRYAYSIDARNTSSTWVDEFTVEDGLDAVRAGLASLEAVVTPRARGDFDGKMNVWYTTGADTRGAGEDAANATRSDGHDNPWLADAEVVGKLGDDGRALDYTDWVLWAADVATDEARELDVARLALADGEQIVGVRFEYGRVERDFTSRESGWDREDIKDPHDDLPAISAARSDGADGGEPGLAPAIMRLRVSDSYEASASLENRARVDLVRNGGGDGLEAHDEDRVIQTLTRSTAPLAQTGRISIALGMAGAAAGAGAAYGIARMVRARRRGRPW